MTTRKTIANARNSFNAKNKAAIAAAEEKKAAIVKTEAEDTKAVDAGKQPDEEIKKEAVNIPEPVALKEDVKETGGKKTTVNTPKAVKEEVKKTGGKKTAAKKTAAKKTVKKEVTQTVYVQYAGKNVAVEDMLPKIKKVWQKAGNKIRDIKDVKLYVKPEDNKVYFVVNDEFCDSVDFD